MRSQAGKQIIRIYILRNISRSKDNQAIKFGQLIEKSSTKFEKTASPRPFNKKIKLSVSLH